jgi:hypothetical protein
MIAARTHPVEFVRVVASLMPKELEATVTAVHAEQMSDDETRRYRQPRRRRSYCGGGRGDASVGGLGCTASSRRRPCGRIVG